MSENVGRLGEGCRQSTFYQHANSRRNSVASLPPKTNFCEPERQNDFRDVKPF